MRPVGSAPVAVGRGVSVGGERGVSLLEIIIAVSLMVVGMFGLIQAMFSANLLERATEERKIAYEFCSTQIETIRSRTFEQITDLPSETPPGYLIAGTIPAGAGSTVTTAAGFKKSIDADADPDMFSLFYSSDSSVPNYDPLLRGLAPQNGFARVAEVTFLDPDGSTGLGEGEGYWVTVRVFWKGTRGDSGLSMSTFVTAR